MGLPLTFHTIVEEICRFTALPEEEVEHRVWMEGLQPGWNVSRDAEHFHVTPFVYNEKMELLYREGDGFIFDCLVYWARPARQRWIEAAAGRIQQYCQRMDQPAGETRVLMLGDGPGNDTLYLAEPGLQIDYFDVPGSKTYQFALRRFEEYGFLDRCISVVERYEQCLQRQYDAIVCFEVLEHLPDARRAIAEIAAMLKPGGIALISEDFGDTVDFLPTHLRVNDRLLGKTPFLFLENHMRLEWYDLDPLFKPYEFVKKEKTGLRDWLAVMRDWRMRGRFLQPYARRITGLLNRVIYWGARP